MPLKNKLNPQAPIFVPQAQRSAWRGFSLPREGKVLKTTPWNPLDSYPKPWPYERISSSESFGEYKNTISKATCHEYYLKRMRLDDSSIESLQASFDKACLRLKAVTYSDAKYKQQIGFYPHDVQSFQDAFNKKWKKRSS